MIEGESGEHVEGECYIVAVVNSARVKLSKYCSVMALTQEFCATDAHLYLWPSQVATIWYV